MSDFPRENNTIGPFCPLTAPSIPGSFISQHFLPQGRQGRAFAITGLPGGGGKGGALSNAIPSVRSFL